MGSLVENVRKKMKLLLGSLCLTRAAYFTFDVDNTWVTPIMLPWDPVRATKTSVLVLYLNFLRSGTISYIMHE